MRTVICHQHLQCLFSGNDGMNSPDSHFLTSDGPFSPLIMKAQFHHFLLWQSICWVFLFCFVCGFFFVCFSLFFGGLWENNKAQSFPKRKGCRGVIHITLPPLKVRGTRRCSLGITPDNQVSSLLLWLWFATLLNCLWQKQGDVENEEGSTVWCLSTWPSEPEGLAFLKHLREFLANGNYIISVWFL